MARRRIKIENLTQHKLFILNEKFDSMVKLKKLKKSNKNRDYYT